MRVERLDPGEPQARAFARQSASPAGVCWRRSCRERGRMVEQVRRRGALVRGASPPRARSAASASEAASRESASRSAPRSVTSRALRRARRRRRAPLRRACSRSGSRRYTAGCGTTRRSGRPDRRRRDASRSSPSSSGRYSIRPSAVTASNALAGEAAVLVRSDEQLDVGARAEPPRPRRSSPPRRRCRSPSSRGATRAGRAGRRRSRGRRATRRSGTAAATPSIVTRTRSSPMRYFAGSGSWRYACSSHADARLSKYSRT